jgi:hypothetical protein
MKRAMGAGVCLLGLVLAASPARAQQVQLDVRQVVLQNFVSTVGTVGVSGGANASVPIPYPDICWWGPFPYPCISWTSCTAGYNYSVSASNVQLQVVPTGIPFTANGHAQASAGLCGVSVSASYSPGLNGLFSAAWNNPAQQVWFAMQSLNVEIYVSLLGYHITFGYVDVAPLFPNPLYRQDLPLSKTFQLPAPISKQITVAAQNASLSLLPGVVRVTSDLAFSSP